MRDIIIYFIVRILTFPLSFLPIKTVHFIGKKVGLIAYFLVRNLRKRALSNLALATSLNLSNEQIVQFAKKALQNLAIVMLEYPKLAKTKDLLKLVDCKTPNFVSDLAAQKKGIIFFCGHQSNWELLFLYGTTLMEGIAIGRPIKNSYLYRWIVSIREKLGGKIIPPKSALKEGLKGLKEGKFLGIVGDQGMPDSQYSFPFLGRRAWSSSAPALLAYKTGSPIIVASTHRKEVKYEICFSKPIYPNLDKPIDEEVKRVMDETLTIFEGQVKQDISGWLWTHNRWKQQLPTILKRRFRFECIGVVLPPDEKSFKLLLKALPTLKAIYPREFISIFAPNNLISLVPQTFEEIIPYTSLSDILKRDFRFKLIFNFTNFKEIKPHFLKLAAFEVVSLKDLKKIYNSNDISEILKGALLKENCHAS